MLFQNLNKSGSGLPQKSRGLTEAEHIQRSQESKNRSGVGTSSAKDQKTEAEDMLIKETPDIMNNKF
jgi:hypothetical protein